MVRIVVTTYDCGVAANVGGAVETWSQVFEIEHPLKTETYQSKVLSVVKEGR